MKKLMFLMLVICSINLGSAQTTVGDATLPNTFTFEDHTLVLNGAGMREKFWIDLYAAGLYLKAKSADANKIVAASEPMAIKLNIVSKMVSSEKMIDAIKEGFEKSTNGNTAPIASEIKEVIGFLQEEIKKGDVFDIIHAPGKGVVLIKNGQMKGQIEGMEFKKALFGIWLANDPADGDLKDAMLGK
ncbi:chalcone isomerase family protein [Salegentibacter sp. F188]|uniref:Chalcone isomerase family protein n=1 Tax=Autumnicola patrickiae TaxID=3075591 RepID=A0ABU3E1J9_9FLAO|nr:chalcone isomerase family protein [Salegentibacter sp. F188]MDT0689876.1 chalcone isomerase family protein [Salegentibacter sp. F188]